MGKRVQWDEEALRSILKGVRVLGQAVRSVFGPWGRHVVIQHDEGVLLIKEGRRVAEEIVLENRFENMGVKFVKEACLKCGEGASLAMILAVALYTEGVKAVVSGVHPASIKQGMDKAVACVCKRLDEMAVVGKKFEEFKWNKGYLSSYFVTNPSTMAAEIENADVLVLGKVYARSEEITPILEKIIKGDLKSLLIVGSVKGEALSTLVLCKVKAGLPLCAVDLPELEEERRALLFFTGATPLTKEFDVSMLGKVRQVSSTKYQTSLMHNPQREVPGGGVALLRAAASLKNLHLTGEEEIGLDLVFKACFVPAITLANHCGENGMRVAEKVYAEQDDIGYNVVTGEFSGLVKDGVVDSVSIVQAAVCTAASAAGQLLNAAVLMVDEGDQVNINPSPK